METPTQTTPEAPTSPRLRLDANGHAIPMTEEELREQSEALLHALAETEAIPDDPPVSDEEFWRAIDAGRPERPLFREFY